MIPTVEVQPAAANVLMEEGVIVGEGWLAAMSLDTYVVVVGVVDAPDAQYSRTSE